jgi:uncharacterized iron-regulated membrane protein
MVEVLVEEPLVAEEPAGAAARRARRRRGRKARIRAMAVLRVTHRWVAIVMGLLLLVVTMTGSLLLFKPEMHRLAQSSSFAATASAHPISAQRALAIVQRAKPKLGATSVGWSHGTWEVPSSDYKRFVNVDPGTGRILGERGEIGVIGFLDNLHECALSCEGQPGYVKQLNDKMPDLGIQGISKLTIGGFILGTIGLVFVFLVIGGLVLWWPGVRRWRRGFEVRARKGRYARDFDLHKLAGFVALPFLAMWAFTGANFELPVVHKVGDILLPGATASEAATTFKSLPVEKGTPDITVEQASAAALRYEGGGRIVNVSSPAKTDATAAFTFCIDKGFNWWRDYEGCPGSKFAAVDRHDATRVRDTWHSDNVAQFAFGKQTEAMHFGALAGWAPRTLFFSMGMMPLLLAVTGMSTWLYKRGKRKAAARRSAKDHAVVAA